MFTTVWHTLFFDPIYNGLVFFIDVIPGGDVGLAIVAITVLVKVALLPLSVKAAKTQVIMRELEPKLKDIKAKFKDKREEQAKAMMEIYKDAGLNPFASILLIMVQLPIIFSLYYAVYRGGGVPLPEINTALLYSFIPNPEVVNMIFAGIVNIAEQSLPLAILAGATQFVQAQLSIPKPAPRDPDATPNLKDDFARSMQMQMRYMMPILIGFVAYYISAAIALYFIVSNLVAIGQEFVVRKYKRS